MPCSARRERCDGRGGRRLDSEDSQYEEPAAMANYVRFRRPDGRNGAGLLEGEQIAVIEEPFWASTKRTGETLAVSSVRLLAPSEPRSVVCVGLNYSSHLQGR